MGEKEVEKILEENFDESGVDYCDKCHKEANVYSEKIRSEICEFNFFCASCAVDKWVKKQNAK